VPNDRPPSHLKAHASRAQPLALLACACRCTAHSAALRHHPCPRVPSPGLRVWKLTASLSARRRCAFACVAVAQGVQFEDFVLDRAVKGGSKPSGVRLVNAHAPGSGPIDGFFKDADTVPKKAAKKANRGPLSGPIDGFFKDSEDEPAGGADTRAPESGKTQEAPAEAVYEGRAFCSWPPFLPPSLFICHADAHASSNTQRVWRSQCITALSTGSRERLPARL